MSAISPTVRRTARRYLEPSIGHRLNGPRPERRARDIVGTLLAGLGCTDEVFDAQLAVQELVTNALRYAPPPHELRIFITPVDVEIAVADGGADHRSVAERLTEAPEETLSVDESGRGLRIVSALFPGACGAAPAPAAPGYPAGKQVWITVPRPKLP
jgi:hypothetical protein